MASHFRLQYYLGGRYICNVYLSSFWASHAVLAEEYSHRSLRYPSTVSSSPPPSPLPPYFLTF
jgi:hypothetical protein